MGNESDHTRAPGDNVEQCIAAADVDIFLVVVLPMLLEVPRRWVLSSRRQGRYAQRGNAYAYADGHPLVIPHRTLVMYSFVQVFKRSCSWMNLSVQKCMLEKVLVVLFPLPWRDGM